MLLPEQITAMLSLGLLGYPLLHSLSPRLHSAALKSLGLDGEYRLYPVPPLPEGALPLADLFRRLRAGEIGGLNVTIPHKQAVLPYLDRLTNTARAIGAVNTIFYQDRLWVGDNTDAPGFLSDLNRLLPARPPDSLALVLGAGGAARAVVYSLLSAGWQVYVAARQEAQVQALVDSLSVGERQRFSACPLMLSAGMLAHLPDTPDLIVNATSAGMMPNVDSCPWPPGEPWPQGAFIYDLVYKPAETAFLRQARAAGLSTANGLGMLVEQAALSLERWSGQSVPRQPMWQAVQG
jgi:shikimate dehydrogenase